MVALVASSQKEKISEREGIVKSATRLVFSMQTTERRRRRRTVRVMLLVSMAMRVAGETVSASAFMWSSRGRSRHKRYTRLVGVLVEVWGRRHYGGDLIDLGIKSLDHCRVLIFLRITKDIVVLCGRTEDGLDAWPVLGLRSVLLRCGLISTHV